MEVMFFKNLLLTVGFATALKIDSFGPITNEQQWVTDAIAKNPSLKESKPVSKYCQSLGVFDAMEFAGNLCIVSIWRDVSSLNYLSHS